MDCAAPVAWRATPEAVYLVGTSASPVADDQLAVEVTLREGATLVVRSNAATVAWSGRGSTTTVTARVGAGADLDWAPEPLITTAGCRHRQTAQVELTASSRLRWQEMLVLGRHGEVTGSLLSELAVDLDGRPLLRHSLAAGPGTPGWDSPAVLGRARAVGLVLRAGAGCAGAAPASGPGWSVSPLDGPGVLALAVGPGALEVADALVEASAHLPP